MGFDKGVMLHGELKNVFEDLCRAFKTLLDIAFFKYDLAVRVGIGR